MLGKYHTLSGALFWYLVFAFKSATDEPTISQNISNLTRLNVSPAAGEVKLTGVPAVHPRPAPDNVTISLPFEGTTKAGVNVNDAVTPVAPLITLLSDTTGALLPRDPSTIAGNVPDALEASTLPSALVRAQDTPVKAACAALGFVTRNENAMTEPALKAPAVSVTVSTCDPLMLAVPDAPDDGDVNLTTPLLTLKPAPESVATILPLDGSATLGAMETYMVTAAAALMTLLSVTVGASAVKTAGKEPRAPTPRITPLASTTADATATIAGCAAEGLVTVPNVSPMGELAPNGAKLLNVTVSTCALRLAVVRQNAAGGTSANADAPGGFHLKSNVSDARLSLNRTSTLYRNAASKPYWSRGDPLGPITVFAASS